MALLHTHRAHPNAVLVVPLQVAIALGGDVIYFELDPMGQLLEAEKKEVRNLDSLG